MLSNNSSKGRQSQVTCYVTTPETTPAGLTHLDSGSVDYNDDEDDVDDDDDDGDVDDNDGYVDDDDDGDDKRW